MLFYLIVNIVAWTLLHMQFIIQANNIRSMTQNLYLYGDSVKLTFRNSVFKVKSYFRYFYLRLLPTDNKGETYFNFLWIKNIGSAGWIRITYRRLTFLNWWYWRSSLFWSSTFSISKSAVDDLMPAISCFSKSKDIRIAISSALQWNSLCNTLLLKLFLNANSLLISLLIAQYWRSVMSPSITNITVVEFFSL